ncbi:TPA: hypothetical protein DIC38_03225 [Candidatus Nomurabacteria bacterium]|nr:MAG: hypothetical protein O210_OD1C00001G0138 [Parcubacteria bacterium RAAC4_OD1_1]HCY26664.1 hypothetical protein [Candidatus Nomurabacteria bacterium]
MSINKICGGDNYTFNDKSMTISMPISVPRFPEKIIFNDYDLSLKMTFHVTLVPIGELIKKHKIEIPNFNDLILEDFCSFVNSNKIELIKYRNEFRFVEENDLRSVVIMCDVTNLDIFFKLINEKYNLNLETSPTHVTLYILPDKGGIFILDSEDLKNKTELIEIPELSNYLK